jgi:transposase InsO family protein
VNAHKNARTTLHIRELIVARHEAGWEIGEIADAIGVSVRTVHKWLTRFRQGGLAGLQNGASAARRIANRLSDHTVALIVRLRRDHRLTGAAIARRLNLKRATVAGWLTRLGLGRLARLSSPQPPCRYERERAGELIHIDTKKLGRFARPGHRVTGDRTGQSNARGAGYDALHVAIDDATRLAYVEILPDEKRASAIGFLIRMLRYFRSQGVAVERVMTDNGSAYKSHRFRKALRLLKIKHIRTRPYTPRTNGKAERFIQTCLREWAYVKAYPSSKRRNAALPTFINRYNRKRPHASLNGKSPADALQLKR